MTRLFLAANALLWLPYGLYCFLVPEFLAEAAAVSATTSTGTVELRAMYGGLQAGIGGGVIPGAKGNARIKFNHDIVWSGLQF